jgi:hypothetical protein
MTVSCILCCCLLAQADGGWELSGKTGGSEVRLDALARELSTSRELALEKIRTRLEMAPGKLSIRWVIRLRRSGEGLAVVKAEAGWTEVGKTEVVVTIPAWRYLAFPSKVRRVVVHEAVHAVMASRIGTAEAYLAVPVWFREGTALLVSGEGRERVNDRISATLLKGGSSADFLAGVTGRQVYPAEGYLSVLWIEQRLGASGFRALLSRLAEGGVFKAELEKLTGLRMAGLEKAMLQDSVRRISRRISSPSERLFKDALRQAQAGHYDRSRESLSVLGSIGVSLAVHDSAIFLHARTLVEEGRYSEAAGQFEGLLRKGYEVSWEPEIFEQLGRCRAGMGKPREAILAWKMVAERFPHDSAVQGRIAVLLDKLK